LSYYLSKVLPLLLMPVPIAILLALVALVFVFRSQRRAALGSLASAIVILWAFALPTVSGRLLWSLEQQYPPTPTRELPTADCLVVLGGALGFATYPRVEIELTDAIDRVYQAANLYREGKGQTIIVAAGNQPWARDLVPEANLIRDLLVQWGVPAAAILLDPDSRNTHENAINGAELIRQAACESTYLVTSAWHMKRALATFRRQGVELTPVSVDIRSAPVSLGSIAQLIPRADALAESSQAIMEWLGIWVYRWKGWSQE
jgi:uncharacterized SAM-binding protein YcdF (DUF218 family)